MLSLSCERYIEGGRAGKGGGGNRGRTTGWRGEI